METVTKTAINPNTDQHYLIEMPGPEPVRQAILDLEFPKEGIRVVVATQRLADKFQLSNEQKNAKNRSNLNVFRYDVVAPQFRRLLGEGKLKQPGGARTRYFLPESVGVPPAVGMVERMAVNPNTGKEYKIMLPATPVVKQALLDFDYPASGIQIKDIAEALADQFELTDEQRKAKYNHGLVWRFYVNIAANTLVDSEKLLRLRRGWITNPEQPDVETSDSDVGALDADDDSPFSDGDTPSPEVVIERNYREHRDRLKKDLLQKVMDNPPDFFEELVLDLLVEMGYGGSRADAEAVGRSGDGGIDGIINQDKLGLDVIYVQAKRQRNNIGVDLVRDFTGALDSKGALKGIFITTSDFTQDAKKFVEDLSSRQIILIDGKQLVQLMVDHNVGISLGNFYQLKEIDLDYFAIDEDEVVDGE